MKNILIILTIAILGAFIGNKAVADAPEFTYTSDDYVADQPQKIKIFLFNINGEVPGSNEKIEELISKWLSDTSESKRIIKWDVVRANNYLMEIIYHYRIVPPAK